MKVKLIIFSMCVWVSGLLITACSSHKDEPQLKEAANGFAATFFNWQLNEALPYCTPESKKWIEYAGSQITQEDIDLLKAQDEGASHQLEDINYQAGDTTATVIVKVKNVMLLDSIGKSGMMMDKASFQIHLCYRNKQWKVLLTSLPRPMRNSDI